MKKLMMFAAAMTIAGGAFADACGIPQESKNCTYGVWDLTLSGKTTVDDKKGYIKTASLKLSGLLVFKNAELYIDDPAGTTWDEIIITTNDALEEVVTTNTWAVQVPSGECCVEALDVFLSDKKSGEGFYFEDNAIHKLSVFGSGMLKTLKSGKSTSVESDIAWTIGQGLSDGYTLQFVGWGKAKRYFLDEKQSVDLGNCELGEVAICAEWFEAGNWSGYFTGTWAELYGNDEMHPWACNDEITCVALYGGTWKSKYNKKLSGVYYESIDEVPASFAAALKVKTEWDEKN